MRSLLKVQRQCKWHAAKWPFKKFCASVAVSDKPYAGVTCVQGVVDLGAHWRPARQHRRVPSHLRPEFPQLVLQGPRDLPTQQLGEPVHPHFRPAHVWRRPLHLRVRHLPVGQRAGHHRSRHVGWALHFSSIFFLLLLPCLQEAVALHQPWWAPPESSAYQHSSPKSAPSFAVVRPSNLKPIPSEVFAGSMPE